MHAVHRFLWHWHKASRTVSPAAEQTRITGKTDHYGRDIALSNLHLKCSKLFSAEDSGEYELVNIRVSDCKFITDAELKINRKNGKEFKFENIVISAKQEHAE